MQVNGNVSVKKYDSVMIASLVLTADHSARKLAAAGFKHLQRVLGWSQEAGQEVNTPTDERVLCEGITDLDDIRYVEKLETGGYLIETTNPDNAFALMQMLSLIGGILHASGADNVFLAPLSGKPTFMVYVSPAGAIINLTETHGLRSARRLGKGAFSINAMAGGGYRWIDNALNIHNTDAWKPMKIEQGAFEGKHKALDSSVFLGRPNYLGANRGYTVLLSTPTQIVTVKVNNGVMTIIGIEDNDGSFVVGGLASAKSGAAAGIVSLRGPKGKDASKVVFTPSSAAPKGFFSGGAV